MNITHQPALDFLHRDAFSPSSAASIGSNGACASRAMAEKLLRSEGNPFEPSALGNLWHSVAEDLYGLEPEERTQDRATDLLLEACSKVIPPGPTGSKSRRRWATLFAEGRNAGWGTFDIEDPRMVDIVSREELVTDVEIEGVPFVGYIDRTTRMETGGLRIGDYKTSRKMPTQIAKYGDAHGDQQRLYFLAKKELGAQVESAELLYTRNTIGTKKVVAVSVPRLRATAKSFKSSWNKHRSYVENGWLPTTTGPLCGWCPLVAVCPAAAKESLVDRSGNAVEGLVLENETGVVVDEPKKKKVAAAAGDGPIGRIVGGPDPYPEFLADTDTADVADDDVAAVDVAAVAGDDDETRPDEPAAIVNVPRSAFDKAAQEIAAGRTHSHHTNKENIMDRTNIPLLGEGKPYFESANDELNVASYAAGAVWSLTTAAADELHKAGVSVGPRNLKNVTDLLAHITSQVANAITGNGDDLQGGGHSRARHVLFTSLRLDPMPWNATEDDWEEWTAKTIRRCIAMCQTAILTYYNGHNDPDFSSLAAIDASPWPAEPTELRVV